MSEILFTNALYDVSFNRQQQQQLQLQLHQQLGKDMRPKQICCLDLNPPPLSPTLSFSYDTEKLQRRQKFFYKINAQFLKNQRTKNIICGKTHYLYNKKKKYQFITMLLNFTICLEMVISVFISYTIDRPINQFRSNISKERQSGFLEFHSAQY